ncbi:hypothetical protein GJ744_003099 [Endocarpon pusillum]|uniref:Uncharacterized protein n=1 Tax=Endocarpon pusillum TaxID=364733 RepID=A0A8H7ART6_9EURO|nr:hypothetical protein GJ744_003099 [Endocarpon pusillum]
MVKCALLKTEGYSKNVTVNAVRNDTSPQQRIQYYYGEYNRTGIDAKPWTYQYSAGPPSEAIDHAWDQLDYTLDVATASVAPDGSVNENSSFLPILDLIVPAADISLIFLSANDIMFQEPSKDDWYAAERPTTQKFSFFEDENRSFYVRNEPVRVLGCASRYQFCNPNIERNSSCTTWGGIEQTMALAGNLWQTERQKVLVGLSMDRILGLNAQSLGMAVVPFRTINGKMR